MVAQGYGPGNGHLGRLAFHSSEDKPGSAADELTYRVELTSAACGLGDHVQDDLPQILGRQAGKDLIGPSGACVVQGNGGNDCVRKPCLLPDQAEHGLGRPVRADLPSRFHKASP